MKKKYLSLLALAALLSPALAPAQTAWYAPVVMRGEFPPPQMQTPTVAQWPESSYIDTANTADPNYVGWFDMRRDVFNASTYLKSQGLRVLVAWDIDLTLGTPLAPGSRVSLASDPWWNEQSDLLLKNFTAAYGPRKDAEGRLLWSADVQARYDARYGQLIQLNNELHKHITLKPVETFVPSEIRTAQNAGVHMMAVTSRAPDMEAATLQDITGDLRLDFSRSAPGGAGFSLVDFKINEKARPSTYRQGVLQTSGQSKGDQLLHIFKAANYTPDVVFFLDDTAKNTKDVFLALKKAGIEVHVIRYGYEDPRVEAYRAPGSLQPCVAQAQLASFRAAGRFPADSAVRDARCDAARNFTLIYGTANPAVN